MRRRGRVDRTVSYRAGVLSELVSFGEGGVTDHDARALLERVLRTGEFSPRFSDAPAEVRAWPPDQIDAYRTWIRWLLHRLVKSSPAAEQVDDVEQDLHLKIWPVGAGAAVVLAIGGSTWDILRFQTLDLLRAVGLDRIRRCPSCPRLFARVGKLDYCSRQCAQRVRASRFYAAHRDEVLEKRHEDYKKRRRRIQKGAQVQRRKRR